MCVYIFTVSVCTYMCIPKKLKSESALDQCVNENNVILVSSYMNNLQGEKDLDETQTDQKNTELSDTVTLQMTLTEKQTHWFGKKCGHWFIYLFI